MVSSEEAMEILDSYNTDRYGNDCLIAEYIAFIRVTYGIYIVLHVTSVMGGRTGNPVETKYGNFREYSEARAYYDKLYEQIK